MAATPDDLPHPESDELRELVPDAIVRIVYRVLYDHRAEGITMVELGREAGPLLAAAGFADEQSQLQRRKRDLHPIFDVERFYFEGKWRHRLVGRRPEPRGSRVGLSARDRAIVLAPQRCARCGRVPLEDEVKLVIDHKIPLEWGGTNELDNLQPLCEECNQGKKDHFASYDRFAPQIREAVEHDEPHRRIGELLKAFRGDWVPGDLVGAVASQKQYQEDWQKRTRELRTLGWDIELERKKVEGRTRVWYRVAHWEPWPEGSIRAEITRRERENAAGRKR